MYEARSDFNEWILREDLSTAKQSKKVREDEKMLAKNLLALNKHASMDVKVCRLQA